MVERQIASVVARKITDVTPNALKSWDFKLSSFRRTVLWRKSTLSSSLTVIMFVLLHRRSTRYSRRKRYKGFEREKRYK